MEGHSDDVSNAGGGGGGIPASPRWNPTKEQISMLENWYKQGIRTPTAEQIQQITARLQAYGHIEGKNVFYWFQNHKARQRQKQKQESLAFFSRCFQNNKPASSPLPVFSPSPNVVCSPCYPAQSELGFYSHYPKMLQQGLIKRRPKPDKLEMIPTSQVPLNDDDSSCKQETLPLFPLEPTGISQTRSSSSSSSLASTSAVISTAPSSSSTINGGLGDHQPYFDFFAGSGRCESDLN